MTADGQKTGRNDPCPCGSGQKYKKCCEAKDDAARAERLAAEQAALKDTLDPEAAEHAKKEGDAAARRGDFQSHSRQPTRAGRPSHVRKRTV